MAISASNKLDTLLCPDLSITYSSGDLKKIEKATEKIVQGREILYSFAGLFSLTDEQLKKVYGALSLFREGIQIGKDVYGGQIRYYRSKIQSNYIEELGRPDHLLYKSERYFNKAAYRENLAKDSIAKKNYAKGINFYLDVMHYEYLGLVCLARTVRVFQDWPAEYPYVWDDYERPTGPDGMRFYFSERDSIMNEQMAIEEKPDPNVPPVNYKVQIAAHTAPMGEEFLRSLYKGNERIDLIKEDGWYKYSVGNLKTFEEAVNLLKKVNLERAFVVAYQEGKKIGLKNALTISKN